MNDPILREWLVYWPAWQTLVEYVSTADPRTACPHSIYGSLLACEHDRLAALIYAHHGQIDTLADATDVLDDLLLMTESGTRPRYGRELGLTAEMFEPGASS